MNNKNLQVKHFLIANSITRKECAKRLKISPSALENKLNGRSQFTQSEIKSLVEMGLNINLII